MRLIYIMYMLKTVVKTSWLLLILSPTHFYFVFFFSFYTDQRPDLTKLTSFNTTSGNINVAEQIGRHYKTFGLQLLEDATGAITDAIERKCLLDAADININIFQKWLTGRGRKPITWATLIEVLRNIQLSTLAHDIEQNL